MLHILHDEINEICMISCICELGNNSFRIDYVQQPTQEQLEQINQLIVAWPLKVAKLEKITQLDSNWSNLTNQGWTSPGGWKLGLNTQDVTLLTGAFILLKETSSLGLGNTTSIIDLDNIPHELNLQEMTQLMLLYGQYRSQISQQYSTKKQAIELAASLEDLEDLDITFIV